MSERVVVDIRSFHGICPIHSRRIASLSPVGVTVSPMVGPERRSNNSFLTGLAGLTGLADPTRCHIEWLVGDKKYCGGN
jgi:hypothetical protein